MVVQKLGQPAALAMLGQRQLGGQRLQLRRAARGHGRPLGHALFERLVERLQLRARRASAPSRSGSSGPAAGRRRVP